jgi:hypothetical protein
MKILDLRSKQTQNVKKKIMNNISQVVFIQKRNKDELFHKGREMNKTHIYQR